MSRPIRKFTDMIDLLNRGRFTEKLDEHLADAIASLEALPAEKGTATISVSITLVYESGRLDIKPTVKSKLPEEKAFASTAFWAVEHALSVQHPSQTDMFSGPMDAEERRRNRESA